MDVYSEQDVIPLSFSRYRNGALVSGLTVNVTVTDAATGSVLLGSTSVPEVASSGIYTYNWTHGLTADTECLVTYTVGTVLYQEFFLITNHSGGTTA